MDRINVIMATYQGEKYLKQQLDSILASSYKNFVISIYDDGSTDQTVEIARSYEKQYPNTIRFYQNKKNLGHFHNFMQGVVGNDFDYIMFCDQDDVWKSNKIEDTYRYMKKVEGKQKQNVPTVVFSDAIVVNEKLEVIDSSVHKSSGLDTSKLDFAHMLMENKIMGCTMMLNRAMIGKVQILPDHARYHDWWLALIASAYGEIHYMNEATMLYRQHGNNVVGNTSFQYYVKERIRNLAQQKKSIQANIKQAEELYRIYKDSLPKRELELLKKFISIQTSGFFKRRWIVINNGFFKSGRIRNIGLLLIL